MNGLLKKGAGGAILSCFVLCGCGGGSSGGGGIKWTVTAVNPAVSVDLNGGDVVTVTGTNFNVAQVVGCNFGATPAQNFTMIDNTSFRVTTPPAPGGSAGTIDIEVFSLNANSRILFGAFTYVGTQGPPSPQTINPTTYTATGAESFTIQGTNLGPPSGTADVTFAGVGTVTGAVNGTSQFVNANAPMSAGVPPAGLVTVTVTNGSQSADVPTQVTYSWTAPVTIPVAGQAPGNLVALAPGYAVLCVAGPQGGAPFAWGDANDEIVIVQGPPAATQVTRVPAGYLSAANSVPAVLDADTFCVYSIGPNGTAGDADDGIWVVTNARTGPVATNFHTVPALNSAPLTAVSATRVAFTSGGADGIRNSAANDDELRVLDVTTGLQMMLGIVGRIDPTAGPGASISIPFSPDGDAVYAMGSGPDGIPLNADDVLLKGKISQPGAPVAAGAGWLAGRPVPAAPALAAGLGGVGRAPGTANDDLVVFSEVGATLLVTRHPLGTAGNPAALAPVLAVGADYIAVAGGGANGLPGDIDDAVIVFDVSSGNSSNLSLPGTPLMTRLGIGDVVLFSPGNDLAAPTGDDRAMILSATLSSQFFVQVPGWNQAILPLTDTDRAFAVGAGLDGLLNSGDEVLLVHQSRALGAARDATALPLGPAGGAGPVRGLEPFVPVGPGWGLVQSPGVDIPSPVFGNSTDLLVLARY